MNRDCMEIPVWYSNGSMMYRRDSLHSDHPESTYNYLKNVLEEVPEDWGIYHTDVEEQQELIGKPKEYLVKKILDLQKEIMCLEKYL